MQQSSRLCITNDRYLNKIQQAVFSSMIMSYNYSDPHNLLHEIICLIKGSEQRLFHLLTMVMQQNNTTLQAILK